MIRQERRYIWLSAALLAAMALLAGPARAGTTGQLAGYVVDADGTPLPGVSVAASSPTQIGGVQATTTDLQGWFQYPRLIPGMFTVSLQLDGFVNQELTEVQVRLGRMTRVQVVMPLAAFADEVTVTETTPVIDTQRTSAGQLFTDDFIQEAAVKMDIRSAYTQVALLAPGTSGLGPGGESGPSWNFSVLGSTGSENIFLIDGLDTSHPYWGGAQVVLPFDSIQEVALESGGFGAEFGRGTGGVINAVTKSGSNNFSGTVDARFTDNSFETSGDHYDPDEQTSGLRIAGATLGGRLVRDRAWFFGSFENQALEYTPTDAPTTGEDAWDQGFVKVTGQLTPSWLALGKYQRSLYETLNGNSSQYTAPEATLRWEEDQAILQGEVSGVLTPSLLWELQAGSQLVEEDLGPMSGDSEPIGHWNPFTNMNTGNVEVMFDRNTQREQIGTSVTSFVDDALGSHEIKLGGEFLRTSLDQFDCYTGLVGGGFCRAGEQGYFFLDWVDDVPSDMYVSTAVERWEMTGTLPSLFIQDTWRVRPDLTLQLGLRWDRAIYDNDLGKAVADLEMLQPRVGASWDLTGNGRNLLRASWGRFMNASFLRLSRAALTTSPGLELWLSCSTWAGEDWSFGLSDPSECAAAASSSGMAWRLDPEGWDPAGWFHLQTYGGAEPTLIAPDLEPIYAETTMIGVERELLRRTSLELSYIDKATRDIFEDTCIGNYPTPTPDAPCNGYAIMNLPQARRDYTAWILSFESRALDRLHVLASYTNSDAKGSIGNGRVTTGTFDLYPYHFDNRYGYLGYHREHRVKASGYVSLPLDFGVGFSGVWGSPFRWTPRQDASAVDRSLYGQIFTEPRGSREGDGWAQLDLQVNKGFTVGDVRVRLIGAVINLFDAENATEVCTRVNGCGDLELGDADEWQRPRRYEVGVRLEF